MFKYRQIRVALMAFALGLSSVWFVRGIVDGLLEPPVQLPDVESIDVIIVNPAYKCGHSLSVGGPNVLFDCGGGGSASGVDNSSDPSSINDGR
jgi:hypothetical protein